MISAQAHVAGMAPYALADMTVAEDKRLVSLAQNESPVAPSPAALAAGEAVLAAGALYPDPDWTDLRMAIADMQALEPDKILCGAGSMELIGAVIRAYAGPQRAVLSTSHAYAFFRTAAQLAGAAYHVAPEDRYRVDVEALLAAFQPGIGVVCIANPGNPTGTTIPGTALRRLRAALPDDVLLLIDEAYAEFDPMAAPVFDLARTGATVITRTFSKAYSLAGARVGWGLFPVEIGAEVRKLLNPNNIPVVSQAMAAAAMRDPGYMHDTVAEISARRDRFAAGLAAIGLAPVESRTNFVLIPFVDADEATSADKALHQHGILMRSMAGFGLAHCLRATIAMEDHMSDALVVLTRWRAGT